MATYYMTVEVEAEQFLPEKDQIPQGVLSDGPRSPKTDPRMAWVLKTENGMDYIKNGEYVVTTADGVHYKMSPEVFEKNYKLKES